MCLPSASCHWVFAREYINVCVILWWSSFPSLVREKAHAAASFKIVQSNSKPMRKCSLAFSSNIHLLLAVDDTGHSLSHLTLLHNFEVKHRSVCSMDRRFVLSGCGCNPCCSAVATRSLRNDLRDNSLVHFC